MYFSLALQSIGWFLLSRGVSEASYTWHTVNCSLTLPPFFPPSLPPHRGYVVIAACHNTAGHAVTVSWFISVSPLAPPYFAVFEINLKYMVDRAVTVSRFVYHSFFPPPPLMVCCGLQSWQHCGHAVTVNPYLGIPVLPSTPNHWCTSLATRKVS